MKWCLRCSQYPATLVRDGRPWTTTTSSSLYVPQHQHITLLADPLGGFCTSVRLDRSRPRMSVDVFPVAGRFVSLG